MKRLLPLCLAMVMALSLTACGGKTPATGSASTTNTTIILAPCPVSLNTRPLHRIPVLYKSFFSVCMSLTKH